MDYFNIYKGKKVLITGHTGFKGSWLAIWLELLGAEVIGVALNPQSLNGIFEYTDIKKNIKDYRINIRNLEELINIFLKEKPEIVFHLAAQALVIESYKNPVETFETNILGTVNVLEAIRTTSSVKSAVIITTDKCYENRERIWGYREDDSMGGHDPYSASKGATEIIINSYRKSFFNKKSSCGIASARAGNVIGGGDWSKDRLVPDIMKAIKEDRIIEIRNPDSIRPWQHVLDPLSGYLKLGIELLNDSLTYEGGWNFGPYNYDVHSVKDVINKIIDFAEKGQWVKINNKEDNHEAKLLLLDITKANLLLKWFPVLDLNQSIKLTVDWYMNVNRDNALDFTHNQIKYYTQLWKLKKGK